MKKRLFTMGLALLMVLTMVPMSCHASNLDAGIGAESTQDILSKYQREIALVEEECGHSIDQISPATRKEIASVANHYLYNPEYRFSELMTDIAVASVSANDDETSPMSSASSKIWKASTVIVRSMPRRSTRLMPGQSKRFPMTG